MDEAGFRSRLEARGLTPASIERSVELVRRFEAFLRQCRPAAEVGRATPGDAERFLGELVRTGDDDEEAGLAVARYLLLVRNDDALVAVLERIDGAEVPARLAERLAEIAGEEARDRVFAGLAIPGFDTAPDVKAAFMAELVRRLCDAVEPEVAVDALTSNLHAQPREEFAEQRERFVAIGDIDRFLDDERDRFLEFLGGLRETGALYYTQPITDDVLAFVRETSAGTAGVRDGRVVRKIKIPYQADRYLHETDPVLRRHAYCHCPWARASILGPGATVPAAFCNCSAGFEKQYWDAVLDQQVRVDVVRSVLQGDDVCEFAVHLPDEVVPVEAVAAG